MEALQVHHQTPCLSASRLWLILWVLTLMDRLQLMIVKTGLLRLEMRRLRAANNVLPPQRGGAVPSPNGDGSKWQDRSPEGLDRKVAPIVSDCFFAGPPVDRSTTGRLLYFLLTGPPFRRLLILALLLISGNVHPNPGPISNHPHPRYPPAPSVI